MPLRDLPMHIGVPQQAQDYHISVLLPLSGVASWWQTELQKHESNEDLRGLSAAPSGISHTEPKEGGEGIPPEIPASSAGVISPLLGKYIITPKTQVISCLTCSHMFWFPVCFFSWWYLLIFSWRLHAALANKSRYEHITFLPRSSSAPIHFSSIFPPHPASYFLSPHTETNKPASPPLFLLLSQPLHLVHLCHRWPRHL